jgi:hypothetical protein
MTAQAHATAVLSLLTGAGLTVHDGAVPANPTYPYAVLYSNTGGRDATNLTLASDHQVYDVQVTAVGATAASARIYATRALTALLDVIPTVTGRTCWPIRLDVAQPAREDRDITIPGTATHPFYVVDVYRVASVPST